jgi:hypothetical protein
MTSPHGGRKVAPVQARTSPTTLDSSRARAETENENESKARAVEDFDRMIAPLGRVDEKQREELLAGWLDQDGPAGVAHCVKRALADAKKPAPYCLSLVRARAWPESPANVQGAVERAEQYVRNAGHLLEGVDLREELGQKGLEQADVERLLALAGCLRKRSGAGPTQNGECPAGGDTLAERLVERHAEVADGSATLSDVTSDETPRERRDREARKRRELIRREQDLRAREHLDAPDPADLEALADFAKEERAFEGPRGTKQRKK